MQLGNVIYYGDNLDILREYIPKDSVDLVYLDPPFKSQQQYNLLYRNVKGEPAEAQVRAFSDTWKWNRAARATYESLMEDPLVPGKVSEMVRAFYQFLGPSEMLAYLVMMTPRLLELHRVLKPTGSLYFHCDPAASHYLKIVLDTVFGARNFRGEIIWTYQKWGRKLASKFQYQHQTVLFYGKRRLGKIKNYPARPWESKEEYVRVRKQKVHVDESGREYVLSDAGRGRRVKRYLDEAMAYGMPVGDVWDDIPALTSSAKERLGYETQKPLALLKRIIETSSNQGDLVLDPICGCGTALVAAEELGRSWIGIDITYLAVDVMARRLRDHFPGISFEIRGQPQDEEGARALAEKDRFQFQVWALSLVSAQPLDQDRKGADRGIDGYLTFLIGREQYERAIVQVKSGHVLPGMVRDLRGVLEREKAPFALLITLERPTEGMQREAADAGFYQVPGIGEEIPRLQILPVRELLQGKRPKVPTTQVSPVATAPRLKRASGKQLPL